jgi:phage baseplate assembly protein W
MASSLIQSDFKISSGLQDQAKVVSKKKAWRDLDLGLTVHPIRKDIIPLKDDAAIKNAVRNLLVTNAYERPFQPSLGANLKGFLFEPGDAITRINIKNRVSQTLKRHEPRIAVTDVDVIDRSEDNAYQINVSYTIKEYDTQENVQIILRRLK